MICINPPPYKPSFATATGKGDNPNYDFYQLLGVHLLPKNSLQGGWSQNIPQDLIQKPEKKQVF